VSRANFLLRVLRVFGLGYMITCTIVLSWTFMVAWFSENKVVLVGIDWYGEAAVELITILLCLPCVVVYLAFLRRGL